MHKLQLNEYRTENLPVLAARVSTSTPRRQLVPAQLDDSTYNHNDDDDKIEELQTQDVGVNTEGSQKRNINSSKQGYMNWKKKSKHWWRVIAHQGSASLMMMQR